MGEYIQTFGKGIIRSYILDDQMHLYTNTIL